MESIETNRDFLKASHWVRGEGRIPDQRKGLPALPPQKPYPSDANLIDLVSPEEFDLGKMPLLDVIRQRQSRRKFLDTALSLEELSYLLWATQGVRKKMEHSDRVITFRTVPSGGSIHSFETYLAINRVDDLEVGFYRYLPLDHKLHFIRPDKQLAEVIADACCGQSFIQEAAVIFAWTTIPYRMEWRYDLRAHKVIALDAGHLCQNLYLASESIGCGTCGIAAYFQDEMDAAINVDGKDEFVIYVAPVGKIESL